MAYATKFEWILFDPTTIPYLNMLAVFQLSIVSSIFFKQVTGNKKMSTASEKEIRSWPRLTLRLFLCSTIVVLWMLILWSLVSDLSARGTPVFESAANALSACFVLLSSQTALLFFLVHAHRKGQSFQVTGAWIASIANVGYSVFVIINQFNRTQCQTITINGFQIVFLVSNLLLAAACNKRSFHGMKQSGKRSQKQASVPSFFFYHWITQVVITGWSKDLSLNDLPSPPTESLSRNLKEIVHPILQCKTATSFMLYILKAQRTRLIEIAFLSIVFNTSQLLIAFSTKRLLEHLLEENDRDASTYVAIALFMGCCVTVSSVCDNRVISLSCLTGINVRTTLMNMIHEKTLKMRLKSDMTAGQVATLASIDADQWRDLFEYHFYFLSAAYSTSAGFILLYCEVGWPALLGLLVLLTSIPVNFFVTKINGKVQKDMMGEKVKRTSRITELLMGVKVVKMNAWEDAYKGLIHNLRQAELRLVRKMLLLQASPMLIYLSAPFFTNVVILTSYTFFNPDFELSLSQLFLILTVVGIIVAPIGGVPRAGQSLVNALVAAGRLIPFFACPNLQGYVTRNHAEAAVEMDASSC